MKIQRPLLPALCAFAFGLAFAINVSAKADDVSCLTSCLASCEGTSTNPAVVALCNFDCPYICSGGGE
ncbi:hypothetical protein [Dyella silvatica]|uniref:hypothetical protein n=1 Tax=Dyella silvatica TaxID=2992128 RepID=UPI0022524570|nr:hypothetical protein [Dyella silvatica]